MGASDTKPTGRPDFLSLLTFGWVNKPIFDAYKGRDVHLDDLYMPDGLRADTGAVEFDEAWADVLAKTGPSRSPLLRTLLRLYGKKFFLGGVFKLLWSALVICGAFYFVKSLLIYVKDDDENRAPYDKAWTGWVLASGFSVAAVLWGALPAVQTDRLRPLRTHATLGSYTDSHRRPVSLSTIRVTDSILSCQARS
jgi:hypothetical protein